MGSPRETGTSAARSGLVTRAGALRRWLSQALACCALSTTAHAGTEALIPTPRSAVIAGEPARFSPACSLLADAPREDVYALRILRRLLPTPDATRPARTIASVRLCAARPASIPAGAIAEQSYALDISGSTVVIRGATRAARLHGVETLRQLWLLGGGTLRPGHIVDGPALRVRGLSIDVSRGRMPTAADLVSMLDLCAAFKLNVFQLYFEDTFQYSHVSPEARPEDAIDPLTLRRVAAEARLRSIEFVPIVQTLAHQERLLSRPGMRRRAERAGSSMFAITEPATRALVGSMVDDVLAASGSRAIHLGCDEAADLGEGASAARARRDGVDGVFREHVQALADRARERWNAGAWIYADQVRLHPALADVLPRDLVLVDWDYDPNTSFASLDTLARAGLERVVTSPGLWDWSTVYPDYARARANIEAATRAARVHGCLGSVLSSWGDGGGECLFGNGVQGIAYFAECAWSTEPWERDAFLPRYCRLRFGIAAPRVDSALRQLEPLQLPSGGYLDRMLYRPVLLRRRTPDWRDAMTAIGERMARARAALANVAGVDLYADAELEALRAATGRLFSAADRERTLDALAGTPLPEPTAQARAAAELDRLAAVADSAQATYERAWCAHNQASGLDTLRARFTVQRSALDSLRGCAVRGELRVYEPAQTVVGDQAHGQTRRSTAGSARSAPRMNTVSGRTAGIQ